MKSIAEKNKKIALGWRQQRLPWRRMLISFMLHRACVELFESISGTAGKKTFFLPCTDNKRSRSRQIIRLPTLGYQHRICLNIKNQAELHTVRLSVLFNFSTYDKNYRATAGH